MKILEYLEKYGHEQLMACHEPSVGLRAFIAIHDTTLGPACGGVRIWPHPTEDEAILDVLRLARAMTYKSAVAGLPLGGGKALIVADPHTDKTEALLRAFGRYVDCDDVSRPFRLGSDPLHCWLRCLRLDLSTRSGMAHTVPTASSSSDLIGAWPQPHRSLVRSPGRHPNF